MIKAIRPPKKQTRPFKATYGRVTKSQEQRYHTKTYKGHVITYMVKRTGIPVKGGVYVHWKEGGLKYFSSIEEAKEAITRVENAKRAKMKKK